MNGSDVDSVGRELDPVLNVSTAGADHSRPVEVRPIHMGEFEGKCTSKLLQQLRKTFGRCMMHAMQQICVGILGGAGSLAIFH